MALIYSSPQSAEMEEMDGETSEGAERLEVCVSGERGREESSNEVLWLVRRD